MTTIIGFSNYTVTADGLTVTNIKTGKIVKPRISPRGYMEVSIRSDAGKWVAQRVHRLVLSQHTNIALTELEAVNHIDGNRTNNNLSNLEACSLKENASLPKHTSKVRDLPKGIHHWKIGKKAFRVVMKFEGKQLPPVYFEKLEDAKEFYIEKFQSLYGVSPYEKNTFSVKGA